jgi:hypothetical protein
MMREVTVHHYGPFRRRFPLRSERIMQCVSVDDPRPVGWIDLT